MIESASRAKFGFNFVLFVLVSFGFYFFRVLTKHYRTYGNTTSRVQSSQNIAEMHEGVRSTSQRTDGHEEKHFS